MSEAKRVLHVLAGMNRGGAESFVMNVYRNIDRTRVQFDFVLFRKEECDFNEEIRNMGGKIYWIPRYNGKNHFKFRKDWHAFFKEHPEYSVIHGHVRSTASIYLKIANKHGLSTIAHSHSTSSRGSKAEGFVKRILQLPIRYTADYLFACSDEAGEWLFGAKSLRKDKYRLVKNAIDVGTYLFDKERRIHARAELGISEKFVIGHIASFTPPKNQAFLVDVFKMVQDINEDSVLLLVGDGELRPSIEQKISDLQLTEHVLLTGVRSDIPDLLQAMDVFVFPSLFEGLGLAVIEAQTAGLPCVIADTLPDEAHLTNLCEVLSLNDSLEIWANTILSHNNDLRKNTQKEIINAGYDISTTAQLLENFYLSCVGK